MMKRIVFVLVMSVLTFAIAGCGIGKMVKNYPQVEMKLENPDLENKGGKVDYTIKGVVPPKYLKKKAKMDIQVPFLSYNENGEQTKTIHTITLVGEKSKEKGTVIPYKKGGNFSYSGSFDYDDAYQNAEIGAVSTIAMGKASQTMGVRNLGEGISNTSSLIGFFPSIIETDHNGKISGNGTFVINAPHQYKPEFITETAVIYFEVNQYNMNWGLKLNKVQAAKDQIKKFVDFLYEGKVIDKVIVYGWASPEGEESHNQGLSEKRFEQGKKWFNEQFDKYRKDYAKKNKIKLKDLPMPQLVFENNAKGEDWSGFETAVEKSNIKEKNQILNVVRSQKSNDMREQKIREMTDIYTEIADVILPPLRRSEITLQCNKNNYNEQQIKELVFSNPSLLSLNEKMYAASLYQEDAKKQEIYKAIVNDPATQNEWRAYNNLAVIEIGSFLKGQNTAGQALDHLNKANAVSPNNGIVLNNMAIVHALQGDLKTAKTEFENSAKAVVFPVPQDYNLGLFQILNGDYSKAAQMMNNKNCDYNVALTQVLNKKYADALQTLNCIPEQNAKVLYLKAVVSARMQNASETISNLKAAIGKDASLAKKAAKDPEFKKFRKTEEFKNLVK